MRWNVEGADARTGRDQLLTVEAADEKSAESVARARGMLIAAVRPAKAVSPAEALEQLVAGNIDESTVIAPGPSEQIAAEWNARVTDHFSQKMEIARGEDHDVASREHPSARRAHNKQRPPALFDAIIADITPPEAAESEEPIITAADDPAPGTALDYRGVTGRISGVKFAGSFSQPPEYRGLRIASIVLGVLAGIAYLIGACGLIASVVSLVSAGLSSSSPTYLLSTVAGLFASLSPLLVGAVLHALSSGCLALRDIAQNSFLGR